MSEMSEVVMWPSGESFEREFYKDSLLYPDSKNIPEPCPPMQPHRNKWLYFKYSGPEVLRDSEGRETGLRQHALFGVRSDGRMYRSFVNETIGLLSADCVREVRKQLRHYLEQYLDAPPEADPWPSIEYFATAKGWVKADE